jgi:hypothetical protein
MLPEIFPATLLQLLPPIAILRTPQQQRQKLQRQTVWGRQNAQMDMQTGIDASNRANRAGASPNRHTIDRPKRPTS